MTQFDFYLLNLSFRAPEGLELEKLQSGIEQLSEDCEFIRAYEERTFRHPSIYEEILWEERTVMDALYIPDVSEEIGRDHHFMLQIIIDHSTETNLENDDVIELLDAHDEELVNGLLCLHEVDEIEQQYCVYSRNDWYDFHRYFLGLYPISEEHFTQCCTKYFPKLHFHEGISQSLGTLERGSLTDFSKTIVQSLSCLNDDFEKCRIPNNIPETLRRFSTMSGIETTNEGNAERRDALSFTFITQDEQEIPVYCEPHMKLSGSDSRGDSSYRFNRIYFHPGKPEIADGKILVGHIGNHL